MHRPARGTQLRIFSLVAAMSTLILGACSQDPGSQNKGGASTETIDITATLNASGATFPMPFYEEAIAAFREVAPNITINYAGGGSGKGRQELADQVVDFAGSDGLVKPEDVAKFKGGTFLYFPTVAAPITVSYNLPGVDALKLSPELVARIFQREIKAWNDEAIKKENPGVSLPASGITVAHRSDGSGTTENFTKFLKKATPGWKLGSGSTVEWPADTQAGNGNQGVAQIVKSTQGAIGYVDFSDAKASGLTAASILNKAGKYVAPSLKATSSALDGAQVNPDLSYDPLWAEGDGTYPIAAPTWILIYETQTDKAKGEAMKAFLEFILTDAQELAGEVDYASLPKSLRDAGLSQLDKVKLPT